MYLKHYVVADIFLALELIPRRRLKKWINRAGFGTRKILILKWIVLGSVLTWAYKSTLLSTLVTIRYNKPIDTAADLDRSGLPLVIVDGHEKLENDQRDIMKRIYSRSILVEASPQTQAKYFAMSVITFILTHSKRSYFISNFRISQNLAVFLGSRVYYDAVLTNKVHPSKEPFMMSFYRSFIVPWGSPLQEHNTF